jgi:hypothetical protein
MNLDQLYQQKDMTMHAEATMPSGRDVFRYHIPASLHLKNVFCAYVSQGNLKGCGPTGSCSVCRLVERATVCMVAFAALASIFF